MTAAQPGAEAEQGEVSQGIGWYEFITPTATTRIAYVGESGYLYLPEGGAEESFYLAASRGDVHRLIRADALDVEAMARVLDLHGGEPYLITGGGQVTDCPTCGEVPTDVASHQAAMLRAEILGSVS